MVVAYQGLEESFTYLAARSFFQSSLAKVELTPHSKFRNVFNAVATGLATYGIVALESSSHGSIHGIYDALLNLEGGAFIVGEIGQLEEHCLCAQPRCAGIDALREVFGHAHILECCSDYLDVIDAQRATRDIPDIRRIPTTDSVEACQLVSRAPNGTAAAAIASAGAAKANGLTILMPAIGNDRNAEVTTTQPASKWWNTC